MVFSDFQIIERTWINRRNATRVYLNHEKSGARMLNIINDVGRYFKNEAGLMEVHIRNRILTNKSNSSCSLNLKRKKSCVFN
jgi:hypothetical protein